MNIRLMRDEWIRIYTSDFKINFFRFSCWRISPLCNFIRSNDLGAFFINSGPQWNSYAKEDCGSSVFHVGWHDWYDHWRNTLSLRFVEILTEMVSTCVLLFDNLS
jgi:hypothetical protein